MPLPTTPDELSLASADDLRAYLDQESVAYSKSALKPELLAAARDHMTTAAAVKPPEPVLAPPAPAAPVLPPETSPEELLRLLQAKGFKDAAECREYLNVIDREKAVLEDRKQAILQREEELVQEDIKMTAREESLKKQAETVHADMERQAMIYDKLAVLKKQGLSEANI